MKNNNHKKRSHIDEFARHFYCQHARLNQLRQDKRTARKLERHKNKEETKSLLEEEAQQDA